MELDAFALGRLPVTNAEWRLFMEADGYRDEHWWDTEQARAWRVGELDQSEEKKPLRDVRRDFQREFEAAAEKYRTTQAAGETWRELAAMNDEAFERELDAWSPSGKVIDEPMFWHNPRYNNPAQPVVGVSWYEARAYCNWLGAQTGRDCQLPGEARWEAAARGSAGREFAWGGEVDQARVNCYENHLRTTTPVGIFATGDTPEGLADMNGNVWEWTADLFREYPVRPGDDRDDPEAAGRRVLRGGSFFGARNNVRTASRDHSLPAPRSDGLGFRVCCVPPPIDS